MGIARIQPCAMPFLFWLIKEIVSMELPKLKLPSVGFIVSLVIALLIVFAIVRLVLPESWKQYFRV